MIDLSTDEKIHTNLDKEKIWNIEPKHMQGTRTIVSTIFKSLLEWKSTKDVRKELIKLEIAWRVPSTLGVLLQENTFPINAKNEKFR